MERLTITESELLDALAASQHSTAPEDARTVEQLRVVTGWGDGKMRRMLKQIQAEGRLTVHQVTRPGLDGRMYARPAYTITPR